MTLQDTSVNAKEKVALNIYLGFFTRP